MCPFKLRKLDTLVMQGHYNDRGGLHYHLNDVKLLLITFIQKKGIKQTLSWFVVEICEYGFNAFSS